MSVQGVSAGGMSAQDGCVCPGGCLPRRVSNQGGVSAQGCLTRVCLPRGCLPRGVYPGGVSAQGVVSAGGMSAQGGVCLPRGVFAQEGICPGGA